MVLKRRKESAMIGRSKGREKHYCYETAKGRKVNRRWQDEMGEFSLLRMEVGKANITTEDQSVEEKERK